ncbi:enolase C-terminal domain-like protein [Seonamhaeicola maritimus]|uniref:Twin-arginine translocation signal domain-containing protein n=1 Tax=Seonamhaeicola maritimus TaxID=2591822 RepID=A0A5C7GIX5_9FLAO|nr:enolase C-terminal domain-like protein [Seonamhaeicola maritimus]TXG37543.1 twin-arginine translocation signal domain-containing protein [Seonamhaeicola maritimus]
MQTNRRKFLKTAALTGAASTLLPFTSCKPESPTTQINNSIDYTLIDEALNKPVLKRELFSNPVIIETIELLRDRDNFICRVRSKDGAVGISIGHPFYTEIGYPMFNRVKRHFIGKDARDLDTLIHNAAVGNYRLHGIPLNVQMATLEFAILDMLGNIANKQVGQIIGDIHNQKVSIYLGTRINELRKREPEESLELMYQDWEETKAKAIKLRAGVGNNVGNDRDIAPGRTEKLVKLAREKFGDDMNLMIDGNGTYTVDGAIKLGKLLEEYNYYFYEEPIPYEWYEEQKQVQEALNIPMAGGEQESRLHTFRWLIANDVFQVVQPDIFYFGGMIRTKQISRMAQVMGQTIAPHMSSGGLGYLYMLHMVSACQNAAEFHEFKMFATKDANGTVIPVESKAEPFESIDGVINVPTGSGFGINIDPDYIKTHKPMAL